MKRVAITGLVALAIACGGAVEGTQKSKDPPACAQQTSCSDGEQCLMMVTQCPGQAPLEIKCDCSHGTFACPDIGPAPCVHPPAELCGFAGTVSNGESCPPSAKGMKCDSNLQTACYPPGPKLECTCNGAYFVCDTPPPHCPDIDASPPTDAGMTD